MMKSSFSPYNGKPTEYIINEAEFCDQKFFVNESVLIPRVETEEIINLSPPANLIADVGTGSGCIGITLAKKYPKATVYLSDISDDALAVAQKNSTGQIVLKSDLLTHYPTNLLFDLIVANLPYVKTSRIPFLSGSVKNFEPHLALDGGIDGAVLINKLLAQLPGRLKPKGMAILEIDDDHTLQCFNVPKTLKAEIKQDQFKRNRFLIITNE